MRCEDADTVLESSVVRTYFPDHHDTSMYENIKTLLRWFFLVSLYIAILGILGVLLFLRHLSGKRGGFQNITLILFLVLVLNTEVSTSENRVFFWEGENIGKAQIKF